MYANHDDSFEGAFSYDTFLILHIEQDTDEAGMLRDMLASPSRLAQKIRDPRMIQVRSLAEAQNVLAHDAVDCILLGSPDGGEAGLDACQSLAREVPQVAIVLLTERAELDFASKAVRSGAEDVLARGMFSARQVWRAMLFAVERKRHRDSVIRDLKASCRVETEPMAAASARAPRETEAASKRLRILVVDDCETNRRIYEAILQSQGFAFDIATSGLEAISKARETDYGLVLMDFQMPGLDGIETVQCLRAYGCLGERARIIAATGHNPPDARKYYLDAGMDDYLAKPITPRSLLNVIQRNVPASVLGSPV